MTIIRVKCPQCPQSRKYHGQSRRSCSPVATTATPACTTDHDSLSPPFIILHSFSLSINLFSSPPKSSWLPSIPNMLHTPIAIGMKWDQCHGLLCRLSYPIQEYIHTGTYRNIQVYSNSIHELSHKLKREDQHLVAWRLLNFTHHHLVTYCWDMNLIQGYSRLYWSSYTKKWESNWTVLMCYDDLRSIAYRQRPHKEKK